MRILKNRLIIKVIQNIGLTVLTLIIILSIIELYFKLFSPQILNYTTKGMLILDADCGFRPSSNFTGVQSHPEYVVNIKTNSLGLRNKEIELSKKQNEFRIVVLGDSFTFGYGVEGDQTYVYFLNEFLKKYSPFNSSNSNMNVETINCGVGAYGTKKEIKFYEKYCRELNPDLVILGFYVGNDLFDNSEIDPMTISDGLLIKTRSLDDYQKEKNKIFSLNLFLNRFHITHFIKNRISGYEEKKVIIPVEEWYKNQFYHRLSLLLTNSLQSVSKEMEDTLNLLKAFDKSLKSRGVRFVVLLIPFKEQVINLRQEKVKEAILKKTYHLKEEDFDFFLPQKRLKDYFKKNAIPVCDVAPGFVKSRQNRNLYYKEDDHWTVDGHKLTAEILHRFLLRNSTIFNQSQ